MPHSFKRSQPTRVLKPKIIVACEDSKSGRSYIRRIEQVHRSAAVHFEILQHEGTDPRTVVGQLAERIKSDRKQQAWINGKDEAWALFDGDEHRQTEGQRSNWNAAIQQARDLNIGLAVVNPSLEFWYLLHFQNQRSPLTRQQALAQLKNYHPNYEKNLAMYDDLRDKTEDAIQRARELLKIAQENEVDAFDNPCCCGLADLVERLVKLK